MPISCGWSGAHLILEPAEMIVGDYFRESSSGQLNCFNSFLLTRGGGGGKIQFPIRSSADSGALTEPWSSSHLGLGLAGILVVTGRRTIRTTIAVSATTSTAIKLNPIAFARDAVAIASAGARRYRRRIAEGRERASTGAGNI